ncbi:hypothetical protein PIB30_056207 [Stylosanthes scabra]|uniref:Uncharacterized protein n=1 Tax=Stylosanthes scabra TaxID=79078 RepID=A0ABU6ZHZ3_9FABA|nr:hypothetical protein [Stylosanthes scabra]
MVFMEVYYKLKKKTEEGEENRGTEKLGSTKTHQARLSLNHAGAWVQEEQRAKNAQQKEQLQKFQEEQRAKNAQLTHVLAGMSLDCQSGNMYTHWGLQQSNQNLASIAPAKIPRMIRENFQAARPLFHGMLRTRPSERSSSPLDQQAPPSANTPREPNADNN